MRSSLVALFAGLTVAATTLPAQAQTPPPEQEATPQRGGGGDSGGPVTTTTVGGDASAEPVGEVTSSGPSGTWGVGARLREVFMPVGVLHLFLKSASSMAQQGYGAEVTYRKGERDIVFGFEYDNISPSDWNYLGKNDDPTVPGNVAWTHFDNFGLLSADASIIWNAPITDMLDFRYGAGLGLGVTTGNMYKAPNAACSYTNYGDPSMCHPPGVPCTGAGCSWAAIQQSGDPVKPVQGLPVYPIVNFTLGLRLKLGDHASINAEVGIRDVFFAGIGGGYFF